MNIEDSGLSRSEWNALIDEWVFNEKYRALIKRRLLDGICYEPLSEEFNMSVRQVKNIVYKQQKRLFKMINQ